MKLIFQRGHQRNLDLRAALLLEDLRSKLNSNGSFDITDVFETDMKREEIKKIEILGAIKPDRNAKKTAFFGRLPTDTGLLTEKNILICLRPLSQELAELRDTMKSANVTADDLWASNILCAFEKVVFLERSDLNASTGYSLITELDLWHPYILEIPKQEKTQEIRITVFANTELETESDFLDKLNSLAPVDLITNNIPLEQLKVFLQRRSIHLHLDWSIYSRTNGLGPIDSLLSGAYTLLANHNQFNASSVGGSLIRNFEQRTYSEITQSQEETIDKVKLMLERIHTYQTIGFYSDPEVARFSTDNAAILAESRSQFIENFSTC